MLKKVVPLSLAALLSLPSSATVVEFETALGTFSVNLFDEDTPETVDNFLEYVNSGAYTDNAVHRLVPNFVMQAGGFQYNGALPLDPIPTNPPVVNEPVFSNVRGTIAMAKLAGSPNSATSQWFINLDDNSTNLDVQNGGFSVFGQVIGDGMEVVDQIAALPQFDLGGAASAAPLRDFTASNADAGDEPNADNLVLFTQVAVTDPSRITNPDLEPVLNTLLEQSNSGSETPPPAPPAASGSSGGGGSISFSLLAGLFGVLFLRRRKSV